MKDSHSLVNGLLNSDHLSSSMIGSAGITGGGGGSGRIRVCTTTGTGIGIGTGCVPSDGIVGGKGFDICFNSALVRNFNVMGVAVEDFALAAAAAAAKCGNGCVAKLNSRVLDDSLA